MRFGTALKKAREGRKLSLRKLALRLRVNAAYLSRVEAGKVPASERLARRAAKALGADSDEWLLLAGKLPASLRKAKAHRPGKAGLASANLVAEPPVPYGRTILSCRAARLIEDEAFPFERLCAVAELESWRKEVNRPIYHLHKWWAQRLGSVFRALLIGAFAPPGTDLLNVFYQPVRLRDVVIFDPFMGSGTTVGEALKLGARAIGRDINPVAHFAVRNALRPHNRRDIVATFHAIEEDVAPLIRRYYRTPLSNGGSADVLYYFWVKMVPCPQCAQSVDLFSSYIFAQHAYPSRFPDAWAVCPACGGLLHTIFNADRATCRGCGAEFDPRQGPAQGTRATCPSCQQVFQIAKTVQKASSPPAHRLYAKMVLLENGEKVYLTADRFDAELYESAARDLAARKDAYPVVGIEPGYNTNQALNYCYRYWHEMFNARQLLCLSLLADRIRAVEDESLRELFTCLFSGVLEFNNMFTSFKGEGTGAVRHMFSHHILKPERTPLEANPWGTPKSSGAFSTLFESRLLRALEYAENPFELQVTESGGKPTGKKVFNLSCSLGHEIATNYQGFTAGRNPYLSCGDSSRTDLPPASVDAVVTDPPFFDNVHYSQLADFFHVWQRHILGRNGHHATHTTRSVAEVQQEDAGTFTDRLADVWKECHRVLRPEGLLVFTYHHSRPEGWECVLAALVRAGFVIVAAHPIKAEMSVAMPKHQAKEPIDLDIILVCRKRDAAGQRPSPTAILGSAVDAAGRQLQRLNHVSRRLSRNDVRVILAAQVILRLSSSSAEGDAVQALHSLEPGIASEIERLHALQNVAGRRVEQRETTLFELQPSS